MTSPPVKVPRGPVERGTAQGSDRSNLRHLAGSEAALRIVRKYIVGEELKALERLRNAPVSDPKPSSKYKGISKSAPTMRSSGL